MIGPPINMTKAQIEARLRAINKPGFIVGGMGPVVLATAAESQLVAQWEAENPRLNREHLALVEQLDQLGEAEAEVQRAELARERKGRTR